MTISGHGSMSMAAPRMRGWTLERRHVVGVHDGCPAYAGMDPLSDSPSGAGTWLPRVCGDGPLLRIPERIRRMAAPRMRGWTRRVLVGGEVVPGCPAYAGMDPPRARR